MMVLRQNVVLLPLSERLNQEKHQSAIFEPALELKFLVHIPNLTTGASCSVFISHYLYSLKTKSPQCHYVMTL